MLGLNFLLTNNCEEFKYYFAFMNKMAKDMYKKKKEFEENDMKEDDDNEDMDEEDDWNSDES